MPTAGPHAPAGAVTPLHAWTVLGRIERTVWRQMHFASAPDLPLANARSHVIRWSQVLPSPTQDAACSS